MVKRLKFSPQVSWYLTVGTSKTLKLSVHRETRVQPWPSEGTPEGGAEAIVNYTTTLNSWLFRAGDKIQYRVYVEVRPDCTSMGYTSTSSHSSSLSLAPYEARCHLRTPRGASVFAHKRLSRSPSSPPFPAPTNTLASSTSTATTEVATDWYRCL